MVSVESIDSLIKMTRSWRVDPGAQLSITAVVDVDFRRAEVAHAEMLVAPVYPHLPEAIATIAQSLPYLHGAVPGSLVEENIDLWKQPPVALQACYGGRAKSVEVALSKIVAIPHNQGQNIYLLASIAESQVDMGGIPVYLRCNTTGIHISRAEMQRCWPGWEDRFNAGAALGLSGAQLAQAVTDVAGFGQFNAADQVCLPHLAGG